MKKKIGKTLIILSMIGLLAGCGAGSNSDNPNSAAEESEQVAADIDVNSIADKLIKDGDFKDNLAAVDKGIALSRLYQLDEGIILDCAFYTNSNATAEEIAVVTLKDKNDVATVKDAYKKRVDSQKDACKDYLPDEMPKLESAVIYDYGNTVFLCISNDNEKALNIIKDYCK